MAQDEVASSKGAAPDHNSTDSKSASRTSTPAPRMTPESKTVAFQAINTRNENASKESPVPTTQQHTSSMTPPMADVAQDASQTAQTSAVASQPSKLSSQAENLDGAMAEASYGTRSRNRNNARPNYAEDQEMDFDFTSAATTTTTTTTKKKPAADVTTSTGSDAKRTHETTSFQAVNGNGNGTISTKESTPANSTSVGTSKKRKAAGAAAVSLQSQAASATPPPGAVRKAAAAAASSAAPSTLARETNVMTFAKHRNCLNKKGELIADDGTKLSVNGKPPIPLIGRQRLQGEVQPYPASRQHTKSSG